MAEIIRRADHFKHKIYIVKVAGVYVTVTVTASAAVVRRWLSTTLHFHRRYVHQGRLVVGLGVQWTLGGSDTPPETLQLSVGRRCLIFQLARAASVPMKLRRFLNTASHTFVGFWNHSDSQKLKRSEHGLEMRREPLDLRHCAETEDDENLAGASVQEIVEKCLGYEVEQRREVSMSDWYKTCLSEDQVAYATVDAYCAFLIGKNSRVWRLNRETNSSYEKNV